MRFIRSEYSLSVVTDQKVEEGDKIRNVLNNLQKFNVEFALSLQRFFPTGHEYETIVFEKVRVNKLHKDKDMVDLIIFKGQASLMMKDIKFEDLLEIGAVTIKNKILDEYIKVSQWDLLDFEK